MFLTTSLVQNKLKLLANNTTITKRRRSDNYLTEIITNIEATVEVKVAIENQIHETDLKNFN